LLCFCMTLFFNNDGSILITTPILLELTQRLGFTKQQALPYLLGGCLVASSASAPIGVSNLANLIALSIVGLDLNQYAWLMLLPSLFGIAVCCVLLYAVFARQLPESYTLTAWQPAAEAVRWFPPAAGDTWHLPRPQGPPRGQPQERPRPLPGALPPLAGGAGGFDPFLCRAGIVVVVLVRAGFFLGAAHGVPVQWVAMCGALVLLTLYGWRRPRGVWPLLRTAPWPILLFAFAMYTLVYAFHQQGYTHGLAVGLQHVAAAGLWPTVLATGGLLTVMSCLFNNLPSVMVGTVMLTDLHLSPEALKLAYLANVLGSDIGSLLLPLGTLASLLWFHMVRQRLHLTWWDYVRVSLRVIPLSLLAALCALVVWGSWWLS
ncbi:MAG: arsenic transporter, partial [Alicyclobacillus sp.]|nr:arsenic transporter [Alicyclobacillus sp.]